MDIFLGLVGLYLLLGIFLFYRTGYYKKLGQGSDRFTLGQFKKEKVSDKILGLVGYLFRAFFSIVPFFFYPILFLQRYIKEKKSKKSSKSLIKEKVYPPLGIQKGDEGFNLTKPIIIKHPSNHYNLQPTQILYLEDKNNSIINDYFINHYDKVQTILAVINKECQLNLELIYIPRVINELKNNDNFNNILSYYFPEVDNTLKSKLLSEVLSFHTKTFTKTFLDGLSYTGEVFSGFIHILGDSNTGTKEFQYSYTNINPCDEKEFEKALYFYFSHVGIERNTVFYQLSAESSYIVEGNTYQHTEFRFDYDAHKLAQEIKDKIDLLKHSDSQHLLLNVFGQNLIEFVSSEPKGNNGLSRLVIENDFRIILSDYNNLEIELTPLPKAVFLLFILHPEGILLKHLSDHRNELLEIYKQISYRETWDEIIRSIDELTDPTKNSINEKCSRIKEAFIKHFEERQAQFYYITGERGKEKSIKLNRNLVTWKIDNSIFPIPIVAKSIETSKEIEKQVQQLYNTGKEHLYKKSYLEAIEQFSMILDLNKYHFNSLSSRAIANFEIGNYQQAILDNNQAIGLNPTITVAHHNRAEARLMVKDYDGAMEDINIYLLNVNCRCAPSYFMRGLIKMEMKDLRSACQDWFNAKTLGHSIAQTYLDRYPTIKIRKAVFEKHSR